MNAITKKDPPVPFTDEILNKHHLQSMMFIDPTLKAQLFKTCKTLKAGISTNIKELLIPLPLLVFPPKPCWSGFWPRFCNLNYSIYMPLQAIII